MLSNLTYEWTKKLAVTSLFFSSKLSCSYPKLVYIYNQYKSLSPPVTDVRGRESPGNQLHENEGRKIKMAALQGMLSHPQQSKMMASTDYPEWMTAEHRTGVSKVFISMFGSVLSAWNLI